MVGCEIDGKRKLTSDAKRNDKRIKASVNGERSACVDETVKCSVSVPYHQVYSVVQELVLAIREHHSEIQDQGVLSCVAELDNKLWTFGLASSSATKPDSEL